MKPLHRLPLDDWFDDVAHPYDTWPVATNKDLENPRPEEEIADIHQKMYEIATVSYTHLTLPTILRV